MPDLLHFDTEIRKPGATRELLWMEYKAQAGELAMGFPHFCRCYHRDHVRQPVFPDIF
ncbi:hypothetical protein RY966_004923 [Enterobacter kobei]|nr:hypothetical protein [Enterobacter kobei]